MSPLSILLVDDDEDVRTLFEVSLRHRGHHVTIAGTGHEAMRQLGRARFDVVITDMIMPDGDGIDVMKAVRKVQPSPRVIAVSGGGRYINGQYCQSLAQAMGADAALMKPFRPARLIELVETMMVEPGRLPEAAGVTS